MGLINIFCIQTISPWYDSCMSDGSTFIGSIPSYLFSLIITIGIGIGMIWSVWMESSNIKRATTILKNGCIVLSGTLIGGRIGYLMENWGYFQDNLKTIVQLRSGGINWSGTFIGGLVIIYILSLVRGNPFGDISDPLLPLFTCIVLSVWLGSWLTGYAYGVEMKTWWAVPARDEFGNIAFRWPTQLMGSISALSIHFLVEFIIKRWDKHYPGTATCIEIAGLALTIIILELFRADYSSYWKGIDLNVWISVFIVLLTLMFTFFPFKLNSFRVKIEGK